MKAYILRNDKTVLSKKINPKNHEFSHNQGLYVVIPECVNRKIEVDGENKFKRLKDAEIYYFENSSSPIPNKKPGEEDKDPSSGYLDDYVIRNAIEQTGKPGVISLLSKTTSFIRPILQPENIIKLIIFGAIALSLINEIMGRL